MPERKDAMPEPKDAGRERMPAGEMGFTLIELMIVIAIIAILASIAIPNLMSAKLAANETSAVATLRNLTSAQAMVQGAGRIDVDNDAIGEYGTFLEMTGRVKVRRGRLNTVPVGADFSAVGTEIRPAVLSSSLGQVDANGFASKAGYLFMLFLPDSGVNAGWVHEVNTGTTLSPVAALSSSGQTGGGTGKIGVDLSESIWNCYAIPATLGTSGNRCFFASQSGDLLQSPNDVARHTGAAAPVDGRSAFLGTTITSQVATGTKGRDDDIWKVTN